MNRTSFALGGHFFHELRKSAIDCGNAGFPPCSLFKTSFQSSNNVVKGGLDTNTQQYISIRPNDKVSFEQKNVIRLILAIVSNSWRAFQLLQSDSNIEELQFSQVRKKLQNLKVKLTKFCFDLAMALTRSADDRSANNVLRASEAMELNNARAISIQPHQWIGWQVKNGHCAKRLRCLTEMNHSSNYD